MDERGENSIYNPSIRLSRNKPAALVVGAAGFLGSHLVEDLLKRDIQVIGVDDFSTGKREYLEEASKDKNFHLFRSSASDIYLDLVRLDYVFVVSSDGWNLESLKKLVKKHRSRVVFVSDISLYENNHDLTWYKNAESDFANFAHENKLNIRILRLGPIFGPRMHFRQKDAISRLITTTIKGGIQRLQETSQFSTRALYIDDAISLVVKSMFNGSTALKIFDGVNPEPVKVEELKQVLMDPAWYQNRGFDFSQLPPWNTPNLQKTISSLHWQVQTPLLEGIRRTLSYFKSGVRIIEEIDDEKTTEVKPVAEEKIEVEKEKSKKLLVKLPRIRQTVVKLAVAALIFYSLVLPALTIGVGLATLSFQVSKSQEHFKNGQFDQSLARLNSAQGVIASAQQLVDMLWFISQAGILKSEYSQLNLLLEASNLTLDGSRQVILGSRAFQQGVKAVTGEQDSSPTSFFADADVEYREAVNNFSKAKLLLGSPALSEKKSILAKTSKFIEQKISQQEKQAQGGKVFAAVAPQIIGTNSKNSYLILVQNNWELRPTGGAISAVLYLELEKGKLKLLEAESVDDLDERLAEAVEPPNQLKKDFGASKWQLKDANWEPDFAVSARQVEWFYYKQTGRKVNGVISIDLDSLKQLLGIVGPVETTDFTSTVTADNLSEQLFSYTDKGASNQQTRKFITQISEQIFNKALFLPSSQPKFAESFGNLFENKGIQVYFSEPKLFIFASSQGWSTSMAKPGPEEFIFPVEANLGGNLANKSLQRQYFLETEINQDGDISHKLRISFRNPANEQGINLKYKNSMRLYLPFGGKIKEIRWAEADLSKQVVSFSDYGRSGYAFLLELMPGEEKVLYVEHQSPYKLSFKSGVADFNLHIVKQPGIPAEKLDWKLRYPASFRVNGQKHNLATPEYNQTVNFSGNQYFYTVFSK